MDINEATAPPPPPTGAAPQDDKSLALLTHLSGIVLGFILPLVIWLMNKDKADKGWLNDQAKEALNFQITVIIAMFISSLLTVVLIGLLLMPLVWVINVVFCIIAAMKVNEGVAYRYPFALRLIK